MAHISAHGKGSKLWLGIEVNKLSTKYKEICGNGTYVAASMKHLPNVLMLMPNSFYFLFSWFLVPSGELACHVWLIWVEPVRWDIITRANVLCSMQFLQHGLGSQSRRTWGRPCNATLQHDYDWTSVPSGCVMDTQQDLLPISLTASASLCTHCYYTAFLWRNISQLKQLEVYY